MKKNDLLLVLSLIMIFNTTNAFSQQFKALLVTKTAGWHHESINEGVEAMRDLAKKNFFDITWHQDAVKITDKYLEQFKVIIFLNTTGDILDSAEQKVMERFIQSGKGYVGIHAASDTEYDWPWYTKLVGRMFHIHPQIQTAKLKLTSNKFPGLQAFDNDRLWTDEWYEFSAEKTTGLNYILAVDESTYNPKADWGSKKGQGMGAFHPIAWYHEFDGGRSFYTNLGHMPTDYTNEAFLNHVYAGIYWAVTGKK